MKDALKGYLALASGLSEVTRQRAVGAAKALVAQGEATAGQVTSLADDLLVQSRSNREAVTALVKYEVDRALGRVGLASNDEVGALTARIRTLEGSVRELHRDLPAAGHGDSSPAKAAPPAKAARATAAKAARATTTPAKTAPAKTAPAKTTPAKTAPAKTAPARAAVARQVPAARAAGRTAATKPAGRTAAVTGQVRAAPGKAAAKAPAAKRGSKAKTPPRPPAATATAKRGT